jgi:hypothetical protein
MRRPPQALQLLGSVLAALTIAAIAIAVVSAHFGPTASAELEAREDVVKARLEAREERLEARQKAREERLKD